MKFFLENRNENVVAGCNKSPKEKYTDQDSKLGPLGFLAHKQAII
jgi:hypothetical protein